MKKPLRTFLNIITFKWLFVGLIWFYKKVISPITPKACIYTPTCSTYALEAIHKHGVAKGIALGTRRLFRCMPHKEGGVDPVPDNPKGDIKWLIY